MFAWPIKRFSAFPIGATSALDDVVNSKKIRILSRMLDLVSSAFAKIIYSQIKRLLLKTSSGKQRISCDKFFISRRYL